MFASFQVTVMALLAASQQPQTLPVLLIVMLLIAQALATACLGCSQPVSRPTCHRCETVGLHAGNFLKKVFFGNDDPFRHKTQ